MHRPAALVALLLLVPALAACGGEPPPSASASAAPSPASSEGGGTVDATGTWQLVEATLDGAPIPLVPHSPVTMSVSGTQVGGTAACNGYGTELRLIDGELRFGEWSQNLMLCEEPIMAVEAAYTQAMSRVRAAVMDGEALILRGEAAELRFLPLPAPPTAEIVGETWLLEATAVDGVVTTAMGEPATLTYGADGTLSGSTGCREFTGRWVEAAGSFVATELVMDDSVCPPDLQTQDGHVTEVAGESRPTLEDGRLVLTARGGTQATYRPAD